MRRGPRLSPDGGRISAVGIPTRNRDRLLKRAVTSYWRNNREWGRSPLYVVVDSSDAACERRSREWLEPCARANGMALSYLGAAERAQHATALAKRSGVPRSLVQFAVAGAAAMPVATGASRNAILLLTRGRRTLQVDDDTVCAVSRSPDHSKGMRWNVAPDDIQYYFSRSDMRTATPSRDDYLAVHETVLGRAIAAGDGAPQLPAHVVASMSGSRGDCGQQSPLVYLFLSGESRRRLLRSRRTYSAALRDGRVLRCVSRTTVASGLSCMAINLGLDNTRLLPPFMPVLRNQDGIFAAVLNATLVGARWGLLPWVIEHAAAPRAFTSNEMWGPARGVRFSELTIALVRQFAATCRAPGSSARLESLGRFLADCGSLTPAGFADLAAAAAERVVRDRLAAVDECLDEGGASPAFWIDDLRRCGRELRRVLRTKNYWIPVDVAAAAGPAAMPCTRRLLLQYGQLLQAWEALLEAADEFERWPRSA